MGTTHASQSRTLLYRHSVTVMSQALARAPTRFVRHRKLGPLQVLMAMQAAHCDGPACGGQSWEDALASLANSFEDGDSALAGQFSVSRAAFHRAVKKVDTVVRSQLWDAYQDMFPHVLGSTLAEMHGKRFAHVDGTQVRTEPSPELVEAVGVQTNGVNVSSHYPTAKWVVVLEAGTQRILGDELCRCKAVGKGVTPVLAREERDGWRRLSEKTLQTHAIIADSGFASYEDMADMVANGNDFIIAVPKSWNLVRQLKATHKSEDIISAPLPRNRKRTLTVRVFTIKDGDGKTRYIATNLIDPFTLSDLRRLYKTRWAIEIWFRYAKDFLALRRLRSKTLHGVRLEMLAVLTLMQAIAALRVRVAHHVNRITNLLCSLKMGFRKTKFSNAVQALWELTRIALTSGLKAEPPLSFNQLMSQLVTYKPGRRYQRISHDPSGVFIAKRPSKSERKALKKQVDAA